MNRANYLLEFKDKLDFDGKDKIIGQAYFLRAYYAFELTKFFGDIPLLVDSSGEVDRILDKRVQNGDQYSMNRVSGTVGQAGTPENAYSLTTFIASVKSTELYVSLMSTLGTEEVAITGLPSTEYTSKSRHLAPCFMHAFNAHVLT